MATLSTELKKYALLATGVAATSVAAQAQITETEVGDIYEDNDYSNEYYDLNDDGQNDLRNYKSTYFSSWSTFNGQIVSSTYSYAILYSQNSDSYRVYFTKEVNANSVIGENTSFMDGTVSFLSAKDKKGQEVYFGFKMVKGAVECNNGGELIGVEKEVLDRADLRTSREIACPFVEDGDVYYGWLKYKYDDFTVEAGAQDKVVAQPLKTTEEKVAVEKEVIKEEVEAVKEEILLSEEPKTKTVTGIKFMGYALADKPNTSLKAGEVNKPAGLATASASDLGLTVYPNPTVNEVNVLANTNVESVSVLNLSGQKVMVNMPATFDVSELNKGMYILEVKTADGIVLQKFTKN